MQHGYLFRFALIVALSLQQVAAPARGSSDIGGIKLISVDAPESELLDGYHNWMLHHPAELPQYQPKTPNPKSLLVATPSLDVYSETGKPLFHGTDSHANSAFINGLPNSIAAVTSSTPREYRPSLSEALGMFSELDFYKKTSSNRNGYTIFAIACSDQARCGEQHKAILALGTHLHAGNISVIEVRIHSEN